MKLKCVIFDFDGTLFDSMYLWDTVAESYVRSRGKVPKPTVREEVRALSLLQAAEHLKKEYDLAETPEEIMAGKDEPVIFRRAMEHFGAQRGSTVVFEDAIHAIETAKKDGFTVAAVFDESEKRQDEVRALADCYITSFEQLEQFWAMTAAD